jgi:hypothetical protein
VEVDGDELLGFERRGEKRRPAADDADLEDSTAVELVHVAEVSLDEPAWLPNDALVVSGGLVRLAGTDQPKLLVVNGKPAKARLLLAWWRAPDPRSPR